MLTVDIKKKLNIHLIGAGGTGGYALEYLSRLLAGGNHTIHVYDGDAVEPKNLKRQNFTFDELDMNKAEAITARLSRNVYQAPTLIPHNGYIKDKDEFIADILTGVDEDEESLIIMLAVDNVATRRLINEIIMDDLALIGIPTIALDSGNDDQGGQVVFYANTPVNFTSPLAPKTCGNLPTMLQIFPEIDKIVDDNPGLRMDCAENAESQPQAMMANVRNGELLASILYQVYGTGSVSGNLWKSDILTGNTNGEFTGFRD